MTTINDVLHKAWRDCAELGILLDRVDFRIVHTNIGTLRNPDFIDTQVTDIDVSGKAVKGFNVTESASHHVSSANVANTGCDTPHTVPKTADDYGAEIRELHETIERLNRQLDERRAALIKADSKIDLLTKHGDRMKELLASARCIAHRKGRDTAWCRFDRAIRDLGISSITALVYKLLDGDLDV